MNDISREIINEANETSYSLLKNSIVSALLGGGASFLFFIIYLIISPSFPFTLLQMTGIIICISFISGIVSIGGTLVDRFLIKRGMDNNIIRQIIVFLITIFVVGGISVLYSVYNSFYKFEPLLLVIGLSGFIIAAILLIIEHFLWKMRRKVLALEIENKYLEEIAQKERLLEETSRHLIVSQERNRIARDLHDSVSQGLNGIKYIIYSMKKKIESTDSRKFSSNLDDLEETTEETLKELRHMIFALKPSSLEEGGLTRALRTQCELYSKRNNINVISKIEEVITLQPEQELAIYRIVQEALTNVQKHSAATEVQIELKGYNEKIKLNIEDNGQGFSLENAEGNGINNMKTRAFQNNGRIFFDSKKGDGTFIEAEFDIMN